MKKTAVDWLVNHIALEGRLPQWLIEKAKEMEKEQISDAYWDGIFYGKFLDGQGYYNETYGKK